MRQREALRELFKFLPWCSRYFNNTKEYKPTTVWEAYWECRVPFSDSTTKHGATFYHFSKHACYTKTFHERRCMCIEVKNRRVVNITTHLPYKGECKHVR